MLEGGIVIVSERGADTLEVTESTVTHAGGLEAWNALVDMVDMWRNRYPNQRFYVLEVDGMSDCMIPNPLRGVKMSHSDDVVEIYHGHTEPAVACGFHARYYLDEVFRQHNAMVTEATA
jgi:hypothetical protein